MSRSFSARRWQLANAQKFRDWDAREGRLDSGLTALCAAIDRTANDLVQDDGTAATVAKCLPDCYARCNEIDFSRLEETVAYATLHLADRYGRVQQVLDELLRIGALPLRRKHGPGVSILEVGAGPAPALYAAIDYYQALAMWAGSNEPSDPRLGATDEPLSLAAVSNPVAIERGASWSNYLHVLSENLGQIAPDIARRLFYSVEIEEFSGFDLQQLHRDRLLAAARQIEAEFDWADEPISSSFARRLVQEERLGGVSAFDLIVLSNILTTADSIDSLAPEVQRLSKALTPGGVLVIMGSAAESYGSLWTRIDELITDTALVRLATQSEPIHAQLDPARAEIIETHIRQGVRSWRDRCSPSSWAEIQSGLPRELRDEQQSFTFPRFRLTAWRRRR